MKNKFNKGDRVKCIDNKYNNFYLTLTMGKIYTIIRNEDGFVRIVNDDRIRWSYEAERFILHEKAVK